MQKSYNITEIYLSIQGESINTGMHGARFGSGTPTIFLRFMGCPIRCSWCDTKYTWDKKHPNYGEGAMEMTLDEVLNAVVEADTCNAQNVCITGGDPDLVPSSDMEALIKNLRSIGYKVTIEASGRLHPSRYKHAHSIVMDVKCPSAGKVALKQTSKAMSYISDLTEADQVKFVIKDEEDYSFMLSTLNKASEMGEVRPAILASPFFNSRGEHNAAWLIDKLLHQEDFNIIFNFQLHKIVWPIEQRRV